nr:MAG TPA: hypothetical protein [Bacteriophage sp.]
MKKLKIIKEYFKLKHKGYTKENRMLVYAMKQYITFDEYEKYFDNKIMKGGE